MVCVTRADAGVRIGSGHVMRCLALAQALRQVGVETVFAMTANATALDARLECEGFAVMRVSACPGSAEDAKEVLRLAQRLRAECVAVDVYNLDKDYQATLKSGGGHLLLIDDDGGAGPYYADIVLNQNLHAVETLYADRVPNALLLLGPSYALLRREFLQWKSRELTVPSRARKVLVTLGGSDPENVTLKVVQALQRISQNELEAVVVIGTDNPHSLELSEAVGHGRNGIRLTNKVSNMVDLMAWADLAVSGGGITCWELAFMGVPFLTIDIAENQRRIAESLHTAGVAWHAGDSATVTPASLADILAEVLGDHDARQRMSAYGRALVDGLGAARVSHHMDSIITSRRRPAAY